MKESHNQVLFLVKDTGNYKRIQIETFNYSLTGVIITVPNLKTLIF